MRGHRVEVGARAAKLLETLKNDEELCVNGEIPMDKLVSERTAVEWGITEGEPIQKRQRKRWVDGHFDLKGWKYALHVLFVLMMTIMGTSAWVTFLPGTGVNKDPLPPTMREVEDHMELNAETQNPPLSGGVFYLGVRAAHDGAAEPGGQDDGLGRAPQVCV